MIISLEGTKTLDKRTEQLIEIRDKMRGLAGQDKPLRQDVFVGLLLAVYWLAQDQGIDIWNLACAIHGDAQTAWRKANPLDGPPE
jgi:hypothetical protein